MKATGAELGVDKKMLQNIVSDKYKSRSSQDHLSDRAPSVEKYRGDILFGERFLT